MGWCSVYRCLACAEKFIGGYKPEHWFLGIQVFVGFVVTTLPLTINSLFRSLSAGDETSNSLSGASAQWALITLAIVMEPNMGGALSKGLLRALGATIGGFLGVAILAIGNQIAVDGWDFSHTSSYRLAPLIILLTAAFGFLIAVHKQRYRRIEHFWFVMLYAMPVVVGAGMRDGQFKLDYCLWRIVNILIGIGVATLVSVVVFPIRARWLLERDMARTLIQVGDLTVWVVNQVCVAPNPDLTMPGTTYTDNSMTYGDDGVERRLRPLQDAAHALEDELAVLGELLVAADKEWYMFKKPRIFPTEQYRTLLRNCHVVLSLTQSLLYWLQSTVVNLALVHAHVCEVRELGIQLSSSFTALSWCIRPPKVKKKGRWRRLLCCACGGQRRHPKHGAGGRKSGKALGAAEADEVSEPERSDTAGAPDPLGTRLGAKELDAAAALPPSAGSGGQQAPQAQQMQRQQQQQQQQQGAEPRAAGVDGDVEAPPTELALVEDDPFAELAEREQRGSWPGLGALPRRLSSLRKRLQPNGMDAAAQAASAAAAAVAATATKASAAAAAVALGTPLPGGGGGAGGGGDGGSSAGGGGSSRCVPPPVMPQNSQTGAAELNPRELALLKLTAMAGTATRLMGLLALERSTAAAQHAAAAPPEAFAAEGLQQAAAFETFAVVVQSGTGMARQAAAMFTALDPARARLLHDRVKAGVKELGRWEAPNQARQPMAPWLGKEA